MNPERLQRIADLVDNPHSEGGFQPVYKMALCESIPESDDYPAWLMKLIDPRVSDAEIGALAREMACAYVEEVAAQRGDDHGS
jgi:hypothetical protein